MKVLRNISLWAYLTRSTYFIASIIADAPSGRPRPAKVKSCRVCYFLMPEGLKSEGLKFLENAAEQYQCSMVVISGFNWNDALSPWPAPGVFRDKKPFGGKSKEFLKALRGEYCLDIEQALGVINAERYLVGVSLSGLFAIWALTQTSVLKGVAAISPSLWYDNFVEWFRSAELIGETRKVHISLGGREKNSKEPRMATVESCTEEIVKILSEKGITLDYQLVPGTHFSEITPKIDSALASLFQED